jgi:putative FmdB family regulatory protein
MKDMPAYDYRCEDNHVFEVTHKMLEEPSIVCKCGKRAKKTILQTPEIFVCWKVKNTDTGHKFLSSVKNGGNIG